MKNIDKIVQLLFGQSSPAANEQLGWLPILIAAMVILAIILAVGIWLWRSVFSEDQAFDSSRRDSAESFDDHHDSSATSKVQESKIPFVPLDPKKVFSSADTVDNKDDELDDELNTRFSSQPTVEETGETGVQFHSNDDSESA